jgi:hypothetical protein
MSRLRHVTLSLCLATVAVPALAQQRLFALTGSEVVEMGEIDPRGATLAREIRRFPLPAGVTTSDAVGILGNEYLAWTADALSTNAAGTRLYVTDALNATWCG